LPSAGALDSSAAGTLPVLDPTDQQGHYFRGLARIDRGDALGAVPDLRRAIVLGSLDRDGATGACSACDAYAALASAYHAADSLVAAERVTGEWIRGQPGSARAWRYLVATQVAQQRYDEAAVANRRAIEISPGHPGDAMYPAEMRIRQADFEVADRLLQDLFRDGTTVVRWKAAWFQTISFRYQGRLDEALEAAERFAAAMPADPGARLHRAQVLLERGREAEAAALFDSSASLARSSAPGGIAARQEAWSLTHRATALAALGDTGSLASLADTIESVGRRSYYGRDRFLHHHVRGLLLAARGDLEAAAAEFRRAVYYPNAGYTRTNVELARVLIELGRPLEAVAILGPALRGPLEASNLYATHTEIHELLGRAWHAAGRADSARIHDEWVLKAWKDADPGFLERRGAVRRRALGRIRRRVSQGDTGLISR
jgi:tetratricopeptide (TPR) repeat protein